MTVLIQLEHPVRDFDLWKAAFDRDPVQREAGGVRRYRIFRPVDDPAYVAVDLEFDDRTTADAFLDALQPPVAIARGAGGIGGSTPSPNRRGSREHDVLIDPVRRHRTVRSDCPTGHDPRIRRADPKAPRRSEEQRTGSA